MVMANAAIYLRPPSATNWFGTDASGFDVFSRVIYAPRIDLAIALAGTVVSAVIGSILGAVGLAIALPLVARWFWRIGVRHYSGASA